MVTLEGKHHQLWHQSFTPRSPLQWDCQIFFGRKQDLYTREQVFEILDDTTTTETTTTTTKPDRGAFTAPRTSAILAELCAFTAQRDD